MKKEIFIVVFCTAFAVLSAGRVALASAKGEGEIKYTVSFVDADNYDTEIFIMQQGSVPEGTTLNVSFPEQIIGSDGHIWKSEAASPQGFTLYQAGTHKYYIEYKQGDKVMEPDKPDADGKAKLEGWLQKAWKADCDITGQSPEENRDPALTVDNDSRNNSRITNLISMIRDGEWHYFYMIGQNYVPQTLVIGTNFDAEYSAVMEETFLVDKEKYTVLRIGVRRNWRPESCAHEWEVVETIASGCLEYGREVCRCLKCRTEETVSLPAPGHCDTDGDSLCDLCGKRAFEQTVGDSIRTVIRTKNGDIPLAFRCLDTDYNGTGMMMYLAEENLGEEITGVCFAENDYNGSPLRKYFNMAFANNSSVAAALQPIAREDGDGRDDYACLLSKEEYERYEDSIGGEGEWFLRTLTDGGIYAVNSDGLLIQAAAAGNTSFGARPFILLKKPETEEKAEPVWWKKGDIQMREIGKKLYRFRCIDEDYSDNQDGHRKSALFLCDSVIPADVDSDSRNLKKLKFGADNNYKTSDVKRWLDQNSLNSSFNLEPVSIGVSTAYTGSTAAGTREQIEDSRLVRHPIGYQFMQGRLFCLSMEEALKYREALWRFGTFQGGPESQISPYSQGYYLRTPFHREGDDGDFCYGEDIYTVDLVKGNIHTVKTSSETYGIRPAFTLPQE
ncbi:hypothetical protein [Clostridium transplantifaecale]|uniref:hypothetical protein n=1 Tax=Clostridium transplantifaecale TaxID=2479838 RepID=UPI000F63AF27|nr:hypothetical protein [Clostridium transplantifaecale]